MLKETEKYLTDNFASKSNEIIKQQVQRIMKPEYQDIYFLKMELWESRLEELMNNKSTPWTEENLLKVIQSLKNNKTMDPMGMINEIFKPEIIGADLVKTLQWLQK